MLTAFMDQYEGDAAGMAAELIQCSRDPEEYSACRALFDVYGGCVMNEQHAKNKNYQQIHDQCETVLERFMLELNDAYGTTRPTDEPIRAALDSIKENKEAIRVGVLRDYVEAVTALGSGEEEDAPAMLAQQEYDYWDMVNSFEKLKKKYRKKWPFNL